MSLLRTFIAVDIPSHLQQLIFQKTATLRNALGTSLVRWVAAENLHLTLKFLGNVSPANVEMLIQMLRAEAGLVQAFDMHMQGLGSFPSPKRPRVLFIGIQASAALEVLYRGIDSACARLGYESDAKGSRGFSPHLTIGRVRQDIPALGRQIIITELTELARTMIDSLGTARVDSVHLYKSDLKPNGSVYTKLFSAPLKN
jgi:RNA 2',3'-cyclic 3'-phosphodiesterase